MKSSAYGCGWLMTNGDSSLKPKRELLHKMKERGAPVTLIDRPEAVLPGAAEDEETRE